MDPCTHEVRAKYWEGIIKACGERPKGKSAKSWMEENGICEQRYYYWQRKLRTQACDLIKESADVAPTKSEGRDVSFVEIPYTQLPSAKYNDPAEGFTGNTKIVHDTPAAVIQTSCLRIEISNDISDSVLARIIREVVSHA